MTIQEIRDYLKLNPQYYSNKNKDKIEDIKSTKEYFFIGKCGHEFLAFPQIAFCRKDKEIGCPYCSGHRVLIGFNDLWTTHPELSKQLINPEDGYKYTENSNKKIYWKCDSCGELIYQSPNKITTKKSFCNNCNNVRSYGEKFILSLLDQLHEIYIKEKKFDWSDNKIYDFYLPEYNCIIEVHGKQHYSNSDFSGLGGRTYIEEQENDEYKKKLALKNGIGEYVIIDCRKSDIDWVRKNILKSILPTLLNFNKSDIDWNICHKSSLMNTTKSICKAYSNGETNVNNLSELFGYSRNSILSKLKHGTVLGWCNYNSDDRKRERDQNNGKRVIETMSKPVIKMDLNDNDLEEYPSLNEAKRITGILHIWDCIVGRRKTAGGYKWRYK